MKLEICHLYPDLLNLYGDRGNIICMKKRLEWRGIEAEITELPLGSSADFSQFDLFFVGGGQDQERELLLGDLNLGKAKEIVSAVEDEKVFLAICGGYQMMGQYYKTYTGKQYDFIGALELYTLGTEQRMVGNCIFECTAESGGSTVVGFENHSGKTYLGRGVSELGRIITGFGNNGEDQTEGARYKNVFCSYSHGPLLPKNPQLADLILLAALQRKYPNACLESLDDDFETAAHTYMLERLKA